MTNYHILDDNYIKNNKKIEISINYNYINEDIVINKEDIIYSSENTKYDLIIIKLKKQEYMKNIKYLEFDDNLFNKNSEKGYNSIYILHYPNSQKSSVSYGNGIVKSEVSYDDIYHRCNTLLGSSGGPILNLSANKVIGMHKGFRQVKGEAKNNLGTFLKKPLKNIINIDKIKENKIKDEKIKDEKIKSLKPQLEDYPGNDNLKSAEIKSPNINNEIKIDIQYDDFKITLKNPIHELNHHKWPVYCLTLMSDGRLVSGSDDHSIIIYNKKKICT